LPSTLGVWSFPAGKSGWLLAMIRGFHFQYRARG
jgi:hypothetical protein